MTDEKVQTYAGEIPEAIMPKHTDTANYLTWQLQEWWDALTPGQQMTAMLRATQVFPPGTGRDQ